MLSERTMKKIDDLVYGLCNSLVKYGEENKEIDANALSEFSNLLNAIGKYHGSKDEIATSSTPTVHIPTKVSKDDVDLNNFVKKVTENLEKELSSAKGVYE